MVLYLILDLFLNKVKDKGKARARDTDTLMNMTVLGQKAVVVVSPLNAFFQFYNGYDTTLCLDLGPNEATEVTKVWQKIAYTANWKSRKSGIHGKIEIRGKSGIHG